MRVLASICLTVAVLFLGSFSPTGAREASQTGAFKIFIPIGQRTGWFEDCELYDPRLIRIIPSEPFGYMLDAGPQFLSLRMDTQGDAEKALALAQRHTALCHVGRGNTRSNSSLYVVDYWTGDSGIATTIPNEDCLAYDPAQVQAGQILRGDVGWSVFEPSPSPNIVHLMFILDTKAQAEQVVAIAKQHTRVCFIGRSNNRPNRQDYVFSYFK